MSDIKNIIDKSSWADRTKKARISFITKLRDELDPNSKGLSFLKDYDLVSEFLLTKYTNPSTRKNKVLDLRAVLNLIKDDKTIKKYDLLNQTLINDNDEYRGNNIVKDKSKFIPYEQLLTLPKIIEDNIKFVYGKLFLSHDEIDKLKSKQAKYKYLKLLNEFLISILYTKEPPIRADWATVLLDKPFENENWFDSKTGIIYWNVFKNVKGFGKQHWKLSNITLNNIKHYILVLNYIINKPVYLLYQLKTSLFQNFTREKFSTYFKTINEKYLHKPLTINDYRKIYESHIINTPGYNELSNDDKKKIHERLLHSTSTAQADYLKIENPISLKEFKESI